VIVKLAIDKADFEKGQPARALYDQILEFLMKNSGKAYAEVEITHEMLQASGPDGVLKTLTSVGVQTLVLATLDNLIADGKVEARRPGAFVYYIATQLDVESKQGASVAVTSEPKNREEIPKAPPKSLSA
jgi:hypothetical protein